MAGSTHRSEPGLKRGDIRGAVLTNRKGTFGVHPIGG
jgi:hypothetical protein